MDPKWLSVKTGFIRHDFPPSEVSRKKGSSRDGGNRVWPPIQPVRAIEELNPVEPGAADAI